MLLPKDVILGCVAPLVLCVVPLLCGDKVGTGAVKDLTRSRITSSI